MQHTHLSKQETKQGLKTPLGILAGNGTLPLYIAERSQKSGRDVCILGIDGTASKDIENYPHTWLKWGEVDKLFKTLKKEKVEQRSVRPGLAYGRCIRSLLDLLDPAERASALAKGDRRIFRPQHRRKTESRLAQHATVNTGPDARLPPLRPSASRIHKRRQSGSRPG